MSIKDDFGGFDAETATASLEVTSSSPPLFPSFSLPLSCPSPCDPFLSPSFSLPVSPSFPCDVFLSPPFSVPVSFSSLCDSFLSPSFSLPVSPSSPCDVFLSPPFSVTVSFSSLCDSFLSPSFSVPVSSSPSCSTLSCSTPPAFLIRQVSPLLVPYIAGFFTFFPSLKHSPPGPPSVLQLSCFLVTLQSFATSSYSISASIAPSTTPSGTTSALITPLSSGYPPICLFLDFFIF